MSGWSGGLRRFSGTPVRLLSVVLHKRQGLRRNPAVRSCYGSNVRLGSVQTSQKVGVPNTLSPLLGNAWVGPRLEPGMLLSGSAMPEPTCWQGWFWFIHVHFNLVMENVGSPGGVPACHWSTMVSLRRVVPKPRSGRSTYPVQNRPDSLGVGLGSGGTLGWWGWGKRGCGAPGVGGRVWWSHPVGASWEPVCSVHLGKGWGSAGPGLSVVGAARWFALSSSVQPNLVRNTSSKPKVELFTGHRP